MIFALSWRYAAYIVMNGSELKTRQASYYKERLCILKISVVRERHYM